jgi:hypothetical protein
MKKFEFDKGWKLLIYFDIILPALLFTAAFFSGLPFLAKIFHSYELFIVNPIPDFTSFVGIIGLLYHLGIIIYTLTKRDLKDIILSILLTIAILVFFWLELNYLVIRPLNFASF